MDLRADEYIKAAKRYFADIAPGRDVIRNAAADFVSWAPISGEFTFRASSRSHVLPRLTLTEAQVLHFQSSWASELESAIAARQPPPEVTPMRKFPDIVFATIFRANISILSNMDAKTGNMRLHPHPGLLDIPIVKPIVRREQGSAEVRISTTSHLLPADEGPYAIFETRVSDDEWGAHMFNRARLRLAEVMSIVELRHQDLLAEQVHDGPVGDWIWADDGPIRLAVRPPTDPKSVLDQVIQDFELLARLAPAERDRFQLAARWYTRGVRALSPVDKLLNLWLSLEVHPARGGNVSRRVLEYLQAHVDAARMSSGLKERLALSGQYCIEDLRNKIVHNGLAFVPRGLENTWDERLLRLEAIVATCLRLLAGLGPGNALDRFLVC